jgi:hypothetical protein
MLNLFAESPERKVRAQVAADRLESSLRDFNQKLTDWHSKTVSVKPQPMDISTAEVFALSPDQVAVIRRSCGK